MNRQCGYEKLLGMVFGGVGGGGTSPPDIFWAKSAIFRYFFPVGLTSVQNFIGLGVTTTELQAPKVGNFGLFSAWLDLKIF